MEKVMILWLQVWLIGSSTLVSMKLLYIRPGIGDRQTVSVCNQPVQPAQLSLAIPLSLSVRVSANAEA